MTLIYRTEVDRLLTAEEVDGNFKDLDNRLHALESGENVRGVQDVVLEGDQMTLIGTQGQTFGPFQLPTLIWRPRGAWQAGETYQALDTVQHESGLYLCQTAHTATEAFQLEFWTVIFQS